MARPGGPTVRRMPEFLAAPAPGKQAGTGQAPSWLPTTHPSIPVWSTIMPAPARSPRSRPHGAPAYYLARPASMWIAASRLPLRTAGPCTAGGLLCLPLA